MQYSALTPSQNLKRMLVLYVTWMTGVSVVAYSAVHSWEYLAESFGFVLSVPDLTPNIGLFWYFFTEVFRTFYLFAYQYHLFIYSIPLYLRLWYPHWHAVAIVLMRCAGSTPCCWCG
jgi:phosphatidylinositol glycan class U